MNTTMNTNPLPEFYNLNAILSGTFHAIFCDCEVIERPKFDGEGLETVLKLNFQVPAEDVVLSKFDNLKLSPKSNLRKDLRQMSGPDFRDEVFNNRDALWKHIRSLFGRAYTIRCEPSEGGAFTRIADIGAEKEPAAKGKLAFVEDADVPF